eukprot:3756154-Pyramimonas_sp.AAC.1
MLDDFGIGTENHKEYVWNMVKNSIAWSIKGSRVKIGRWASWINANREWRGKKMEVLLVLVYIGMLHGWWKSLDGVPITPSAMKILEVDSGDEGEGPAEGDGDGAGSGAAPAAGGAAPAAGAAEESQAPGGGGDPPVDPGAPGQ